MGCPIIISNYIGGRITSEHIVDWNCKVIYNPTEDFTTGNITESEITFTSDYNLPLDQFLGDGLSNSDWRIVEKERVNNSTNLWKYKITPGLQKLNTPGLADLYDEVISDGTPWAEGLTLAQLIHAIKVRLWIDDAINYNPYTGINANYVINHNAPYSGLTAREALRWCAQLGAFNAYDRIMGEVNGGELRTWSIKTPTKRIRLTPNTVKEVVIKDYEVPAIDKIWFGNDSSDLGLSYGSGNQQLSVPINPLINYDDTSFLQPIYDAVSSPSFGGNTTYTPMKISTFISDPLSIETAADSNIFADYTEIINGFSLHIIAFDFSQCYLEYTDENNTTYYSPIFSMEISPKGITFEGTGTPDRSISNAYLTNELAQAGKWNKFQRTIDATISEIGNVDGRVSNLTQTVDGITVTVAGLSTKASTISTDTLYYLATSASSGVTTSTPGWTTTPQSMTATNQYLWTYHKYTYADNHTTDSTPVITGRYGQNGTSGVGITSVTSLYYAKANSTAPAKPTAHVTSTSTAGGAWRVAVPTLSSSYPYMFTCDEILYTDNHYDWTEVVQNTALTNFNSRIEQNASDISLKVSQSDYNGNTIASLINQTATTVTINAQHINLAGAVSFSDLDSSAQAAINDKTDASEVTQIIGNTVNASYINALEINAKKIVSTYTITWNHNNYSQADLTAINNIITSDSGYTDSDLEKYDFNLDGTINISDFVICRNMINNGTDYTASIKTEIDPSIPSRPIAIYSGNTLKSYLSPGRAMAPAGLFNSVVTGNNSKLTADDLYLYRNSTEKALINTTYIHMGDLDNSTGKRLNIDINNGIDFVNSSGNTEVSLGGPARSSYGLTFNDASGNTIIDIGRNGAIDVPNKYRLGYYGSMGDNNGGFLRLYKNNTESTPSIDVDGHTGKVHTYNSSGTVIHQFPPVSLTKPAVTVNTTANTWKYSGLYVSIPAGAFYTFDVRARYSTVAPDFIGVSTSSTTFNNGSGSPEKVSRLPFANGSYVGSNYIDGTSHRMTLSGENDTNSTITYYIWVQTISAGSIGVGVSGYYM